MSAALAALLDDASQFPPGNLPLAEAHARHQAWRAHPQRALVGRFLVPAARAVQLAQLLRERSPHPATTVGLVAGGASPVAAAVLAEVGVPVTAVELRVDELEALDAWRAALPQAWIFVEGIAPGPLVQLCGDDPRVGAKLRCGGVEAAAFPSVEAVARFVADCTAADVPFKATAGLHAPVRHRDDVLGVHHHGFLNLLSATALAQGGAGADELQACLALEDGARLPALGLAPERLAVARTLFHAFGTCSIDEPLDGLAALGLLDG